ncbi:MAG TPA: type VI secretion system-associated FHA domain protein TagH [Steroidobacteraceae bacterium]|nr:type VI secretion system-associated FHA domain protein TagH [Steroidobacteraceae bacterium]
MALRLEIISPQRQTLGSRGSIVLGVAGGSVGRALDNDWALPDSQRFLSGHHARIHFRDGHYIVEDTSSNGVFVNDATKPLGKRGTHRLDAGDILRLGEFRVLVQIDDDDPASLPPPGAATMASLTVQNVVPLRVPASQRPAASDDDLGHSLDIEALIPPDSTGRVPRAAAGSLREIAEAGFNTADTGFSATATAPGSMQDRVNRLRAAARARLEGTSPALSVHNGMQAFCRGAGIDGERIPVASDAQALQLAGRLLREALLGLKEILRAQGAFDDRYGISHEPPEGPSPLELSFDEYLLELLGGHEQRRLDAVLRLRDQFASAARHAGAIDPALRSALTRFVGHLDPVRMNGLPAETSWSRYREIYANLLRTNGGEVPHLFVEALAQAWLEAGKGQR